MKNLIPTGLFLVFLLAASLVKAQVTLKSTPASWNSAYAQISDSNIPAYSPRIPDIAAAKAEDATSGQDRFALPVDVPADIFDNGVWEESEEMFIWRIRISAEAAKAWILCLNQVNLPHGARLYAYSAQHKDLKGAYTHSNNNDRGKLTIGPVGGKDIILEYNIPADREQILPFNLERLYFVYTENPNQPVQAQSLLGDPAYQSSWSCMINVNCPEGENYQAEKNGVVRILIASDKGYYYCTGALMNNTKKDRTPYILSANHCEHGLQPYHDNYIFAFGWETSDCTLPADAPGYQTMTGCELIARREESDFALYKLSSDIPVLINAYFHGWNKSSTKKPVKTTTIHHPNGDVKKISIDNNPAVVWASPITWAYGTTTPANHHWRTSLSKGASMPGSSGAPLYDENKQVVGQLHGGNSSCSLTTLFYGMFSKSWDEGTTPQTRLKDWLDPLNLGKDTLSGLEVKALPVCSISGKITNSKNLPLKKVMVVLSGFTQDTVLTGNDGKYTIDNVVIGKNYTVTPIYGTFALDGVSTGDLAIMNKSILGITPLSSEFKKVAADVNLSNTISTADMNIINKMILGIQYEFPSKKTWVFVTPDYKWPDKAGNANSVNINNVQVDQFNIDFIGIKLGDVTGTN